MIRAVGPAQLLTCLTLFVLGATTAVADDAEATPGTGGQSWWYKTFSNAGHPRNNDTAAWGVISELRGGLSAHNVGPFASKAEDGVDIDAEILFASGKYLKYLAYPRGQIGVHINTAGDTDQLYAGLVWTTDAGSRLLMEATLGLAVHNGELVDSTEKNREFGTRWLFRMSWAVGYRFGETRRHNVSIYLDHASNAEWGDNENEGIDNTGIRYGYRF